MRALVLALAASLGFEPESAPRPVADRPAWPRVRAEDYALWAGDGRSVARQGAPALRFFGVAATDSGR